LALSLTKEAYTRDPRVQSQFCAYWQTLLAEQPSKFSDAQRMDIQQNLQCDFK
jgi:hypothetical protein